jgi:hypothetical protein
MAQIIYPVPVMTRIKKGTFYAARSSSNELELTNTLITNWPHFFCLGPLEICTGSQHAVRGWRENDRPKDSSIGAVINICLATRRRWPDAYLPETILPWGLLKELKDDCFQVAEDADAVCALEMEDNEEYQFFRSVFDRTAQHSIRTCVNLLSKVQQHPREMQHLSLILNTKSLPSWAVVWLPFFTGQKHLLRCCP